MYLTTEKKKEFFKKYGNGHPDFAPEGWGCSPEYRYLPEEKRKGIYDWIWITRTSVLPRAIAANIWTEGGTVMALNEKQEKAAIALFGEDYVKEILIPEGQRRTTELEDAGVEHKSSEGEEEDDGEKEAAFDVGEMVEQVVQIQVVVEVGLVTLTKLVEQVAQELSS